MPLSFHQHLQCGAPTVWFDCREKLRTARRLIWEIGYKLKDTLGNVERCGRSCPNKNLKADMNGCVDTIKEVIVKYHSSYGVEDVEKSYYRQEVTIGFDLPLRKPRYIVPWLQLWHYYLRLQHEISCFIWSKTYFFQFERQATCV